MLSQIPKRSLYIVSVILVTLLALGLRVYAAQRLDIDYDEPVYLAGGVSYADFIRAGDYKMIAWSEYNYEHPPLNKVLYGLVLLTQQPLERLPDKDLPRQAPIAQAAAGPWNVIARYLSVGWGTLTVLALSIVNPLAGLVLAIDTLSVKYTSEVYLEALPLLTSLLCVLAYGRWFAGISGGPADSRKGLIWLLLSALFLGMTVAGKYVYGIVALPVLVHFGIALLRKQVPVRFAMYIVGWGLLSLLMFFAFDPFLWPHPIARIEKSIAFHENFQDSRLVKQYHYPFWQPLRWLADFSAFYDLHPASAFLVDVDTLIFVLAVLGLPALFRKASLYFYWLLIGLAFLLLWQTKWPQYTVAILAPFSLSAAYGAAAIWQWARRLLMRISRQPAAA